MSVSAGLLSGPIYPQLPEQTILVALSQHRSFHLSRCVSILEMFAILLLLLPVIWFNHQTLLIYIYTYIYICLQIYHAPSPEEVEKVHETRREYWYRYALQICSFQPDHTILHSISATFWYSNLDYILAYTVLLCHVLSCFFCVYPLCDFMFIFLLTINIHICTHCYVPCCPQINMLFTRVYVMCLI